MRELEEKKFWTIEEFANYTGYSKGYIYKLTCRKEVPYHKFLGKTMFAREDIFRMIQDGLVRSNEQIEESL